MHSIENNSNIPTTTTTATTTTTGTREMEPNGRHAVTTEDRVSVGRTNSVLVPLGRSSSYNTMTNWGRHAAEFVCVNCKETEVSQTEFKVGNLNWVMTAVCMLCLCLCFCWICLPCGIGPLFMDRFKDVNHICPNCGHINGIKKQMD